MKSYHWLDLRMLPKNTTYFSKTLFEHLSCAITMRYFWVYRELVMCPYDERSIGSGLEICTYKIQSKEHIEQLASQYSYL